MILANYHLLVKGLETLQWNVWQFILLLYDTPHQPLNNSQETGNIWFFKWNNLISKGLSGDDIIINNRKTIIIIKPYRGSVCKLKKGFHSFLTTKFLPFFSSVPAPEEVIIVVWVCENSSGHEGSDEVPAQSSRDVPRPQINLLSSSGLYRRHLNPLTQSGSEIIAIQERASCSDHLQDICVVREECCLVISKSDWQCHLR